MIHEQAIAISVKDNGKIRAKVDRKGACEACQLKSACGQKLISQASSKSCIEFEMENSIGAQKGDLVEIGIPEKALIQASLIMYVLPLLTMMVFAICADALISESEFVISLVGLFGLALGFYLVRFISSTLGKSNFEPNTIRILKHKS